MCRKLKAKTKISFSFLQIEPNEKIGKLKVTFVTDSIPEAREVNKNALHTHCFIIVWICQFWYWLGCFTHTHTSAYAGYKHCHSWHLKYSLGKQKLRILNSNRNSNLELHSGFSSNCFLKFDFNSVLPCLIQSSERNAEFSLTILKTTKVHWISILVQLSPDTESFGTF